MPQKEKIIDQRQAETLRDVVFYDDANDFIRSHTDADPATFGEAIGPFFCHRPQYIGQNVTWFQDHFAPFSANREILYAVKANHAPWVLDECFKAGMAYFDAASLQEIDLVQQAASRAGTTAKIAFMHPIKSAYAIQHAYEKGVRIFAFDDAQELDKIAKATGKATDVTLMLRVAVSSEHAQIKLASKFGAAADIAPELLVKAKTMAAKIGVTFHVGSQAMSPKAFSDALGIISSVLHKFAAFGGENKVDIVDVGGGFPVDYPDMHPEPLYKYMDAINQKLAKLPVAEDCAFWAEPGRAIVAPASSLVVQIVGKRDAPIGSFTQNLYINDGAFGALYDAGILGWRYPVRALDVTRDAFPFSNDAQGYAFYGPTCDDEDFMKGPFYLPYSITYGDFIEIGQMGAYGRVMRSNFNGFGTYTECFVKDDPFHWESKELMQRKDTRAVENEGA